MAGIPPHCDNAPRIKKSPFCAEAYLRNTMPSRLDALARQSRYIILEGKNTRKLALPSDWEVLEVRDQKTLFMAIQESHAKNQRTFLILGDSDFEILQKKLSQEFPSKLGTIVLTESPEDFLRKSDIPEVLDIISEKIFRKSIEFHLLKAVKQLLSIEDRSRKRVSHKTLEKLNEILIALSAERDPQRLLPTILQRAIELTSAGGGALYMLDEIDGEMSLRLKISTNESGEISSEHLHTKMAENSLCGYVALTGKLMNVADVRSLKPQTLPQFNRSMDYSSEKTSSVLTIPLHNTRNELIAILQLADKRNEPAGLAVPFDSDDESLLSSFATQAAICLENVNLYGDIQRLFDGFVKASITAIESRDPSTGGHSERVAKMTVALARVTSDCNVGIYRSVRFKEEEMRELEYAALLHDFGKIGVREQVLVKAKKLYPYQLDAIGERLKTCKAAAKISYLEKRLKTSAHDIQWEREYQHRVRELEGWWEIIVSANEPTVIRKENIEALDRIRSEILPLPDASECSLLTEEEYNALRVTQGSLTESERLEIESHVRHTYQFLKMIPWIRDFRHLPEIAYTHHEKLDGSGYPRGLMAHEIPLQAKMMTIADIYDALTAADRWYKDAVPTEKALEILAEEVSQGKLDPVLFELFVEKKIYEITQPKVWQKAVA